MLLADVLAAAGGGLLNPADRTSGVVTCPRSAPPRNAAANVERLLRIDVPLSRQGLRSV